MQCLAMKTHKMFWQKWFLIFVFLFVSCPLYATPPRCQRSFILLINPNPDDASSHPQAPHYYALPSHLRAQIIHAWSFLQQHPEKTTFVVHYFFDYITREFSFVQESTPLPWFERLKQGALTTQEAALVLSTVFKILQIQATEETTLQSPSIFLQEIPDYTVTQRDPPHLPTQ